MAKKWGSVLMQYGIDFTKKSNKVEIKFDQNIGAIRDILTLEMTADQESWYLFRSKISLNRYGRLFQKEFTVNITDILRVIYWLNEIDDDGAFRIPESILDRNSCKDVFSSGNNYVDGFYDLDDGIYEDSRLVAFPLGMFIDMGESKRFWLFDDRPEIHTHRFYQLVLYANKIFEDGTIGGDIQIVVPESAVLEFLRASIEMVQVTPLQFVRYVIDCADSNKISYIVANKTMEMMMKIADDELGIESLKSFHKSMFSATNVLKIVEETNQFIDNFGWEQLHSNN